MKILPFLFLAVCPLLHAQQPDVPPPFEEGPVEEAEDVADPFDPHLNAPKLVQVQVEYIELAHEKLTDLMFMAKPATADATGLRQKLQELVKKGEARLLETQLVTGRSGEKFVTESVDEYIYPTEAEPPDHPGKVTLPENKGAGWAPDNLKALAALIGPPTPTSFETRDLGSTLEAEPTLGGGGKMIDLRFVPELSWKTGRTIWQERKDPLGNVVKIETPRIYTLRLATTLSLKDGEYVLAGVATPRDQNGEADFARKVMVFVKAESLPVR